MPQNPMLVDQIDIEPGSAGTRRINRDAGTGDLAFQSAVVTTPLLLKQLASLQTIGNVYVVGKTGAGAQYTTIQAALDAVPSAASASNPYFILVMSGIYTETVNLVRDGVRIVGMGNPVLESALEATPDAVGNDHTLIISAQLGTIPKSILIEGMVIRNAHSNKAAVRIVGAAASMVGDDEILLRGCDLQANSTLGNRQLWATACNFIRVDGGRFTETADALGLLLVEEAARLTMVGVQNIAGISLRYDDTNDEPSETSEGYDFIDCPGLGVGSAVAPPIAIDLDNDGAASFTNCDLASGTTFSGDKSFRLTRTTTGKLTLLETVTVTSTDSSTDGVSAPNAGATYDEPQRNGEAVFGAVASVAVAFDVPFSDANYNVVLTPDARPVNDETAWITARAITGFTINFFTVQTLNVRWHTFR